MPFLYSLDQENTSQNVQLELGIHTVLMQGCGCMLLLLRTFSWSKVWEHVSPTLDKKGHVEQIKLSLFVVLKKFLQQKKWYCGLVTSLSEERWDMFTYVVNIGHLSLNIWLVVLDTSASVAILEIPEQTDTVLIWCALAREMQKSAQSRNLGKLGCNIDIFCRVIVLTHPFVFLSFYKKTFCFCNGKWSFGSGVQCLCFHRAFYLTLQCAFLLLFFFSSAYFLVTNAAWLGRKRVQNM